LGPRDRTGIDDERPRKQGKYTQNGQDTSAQYPPPCSLPRTPRG
jgi:hypothetical protein